jgi:hypothetical protein
MGDRRSARRAQVGTVIEALQRAAVAARADSNAQRARIRRARVEGNYRQEMAVDLAKRVAYEQGVCYCLLLAQEVEAARRPIEGVG